jgi:hypothetical protein
MASEARGACQPLGQPVMTGRLLPHYRCRLPWRLRTPTEGRSRMATDPSRSEREAGADTIGTAIGATALVLLAFVFGVYVIVAALAN